MHKLVVNSCTEYFLQKEQEGKIVEGVFDMPDEFSSEVVAPIINFMYTGRLELEAHMFAKLHNVASKLQVCGTSLLHVI